MKRHLLRGLLFTVLLVDVVFLIFTFQFAFPASPPSSTLIYKVGTNWRANPSWRGEIAYALDFDGTNDYVKVLHDSSLCPTSEITIEFWTYLDGKSANDVFLNKGGGNQYIVQIDATGDYLKFYTKIGGSYQTFTSTTSFPLSQWVHVVIIYDGAKVWIYLDGSAEEFTPSPLGSLGTTTSDLIIGADSEVPSVLINGTLDEIRFYSRDIASSEVSYSYNSGTGRYLPYDQSGLVAWWHFNEGEGTATVYDETTNDNDGTIYGATWVSGKVPAPSALHSTFQLGRSLELNNISYLDETLTITKDDEEYHINVTSGINMEADINNWFDTYGTEIEITSSGTYTFDVYVGSKGKPQTVGGADSWSYNSGTGIVTITATASSSQIVRMHWGTGATTKIIAPTFTGHRGLEDGTNINGFGLVAGRSHVYTFETKVWIGNGEKVERVILELANGLTREIELKCEGGGFSRESDAYNYYTMHILDCDLLDENGNSIYWNPYTKYFKIHWVGYFNPNYTPRNYLESTRTTVVTEPTGGGSETSYSNTEIEQYYISSTVSIVSLTLVNPTMGTQGIVAEYRDYTFEVVAKSTIDYNDFNYIQMLLGYGTEHEVILAWVREVDKSLSDWHPSSYEEITDETNFIEQQDYKNIFRLNSDLTKIEAYVLNYPTDNTTYVKVSFIGQFLLQHPSRKLQDVKIVATAYENNEEKTKVYTSVYYVETFLIEQTTTTTEGGWVNDNYAQPYLDVGGTSDYVRTKLTIPNFQKIQYTFSVETMEDIDPSQWANVSTSIFFNFYKNLTVVDSFWIHFIWEQDPVGDHKEIYIWFRSYNFATSLWEDTGGSMLIGANIQISKADYDNFADANPPEGGKWCKILDAWIDINNEEFHIRLTNDVHSEDLGSQYSSWDTQQQGYVAGAQYGEMAYELSSPYLLYDVWGVEMTMQVDRLYGEWMSDRYGFAMDTAHDGYSKVYELKTFDLLHEEKTGVEAPPLVIPEKTVRYPWWIAPFVHALRWLAKGIYFVLKPLFDAIVNALTTVFVLIFKGLTALWNIIVKALDALLYAVTGAPNVFSSAIRAILTWFSNLGQWIIIVGQQIVNIAKVIWQFITIAVYFIGEGIKVIIWFFLSVFVLIPESIGLFFAFLTGGTTTIAGVTVDFTTIGDLARATLLIFGMMFPLMYMNRIFSAVRNRGIMGGVHQFTDDLMMMRNVFEGFFWIFEWIWQKFREIYGFIKSHIPTMGGT